jgi:biopolymer transport protein ExbB/TolQ
VNIALIRILIQSGGNWVIYTLILCSILALAVILERGIQLSIEEKELNLLRRDFLRELAKGWPAMTKIIRSHKGAASRTLSKVLESTVLGPEGVPDLLAAALLSERKHLEKRLLILGTLGNNAPFIGLLGTVLGVIAAFHDLAQAGAGPEAVMKGLSEALVATAVGIFVAIPCVVAYNVFSKKVRDILSETESLGHLIAAQLRAEKSSSPHA